MTSQTGIQMITIHILLNISRSKGHQATKFNQVIEHNMRNNYLEKSYQNVVEKLVPDPLQKFKIEHISGSTI